MGGCYLFAKRNLIELMSNSPLVDVFSRRVSRNSQEGGGGPKIPGHAPDLVHGRDVFTSGACLRGKLK